MAVPSWDELLSQARQITEQNAQTEATNRTNTLFAKGVSDIFNQDIGGAQKANAGYVDPETGGFTAAKSYSGGSGAERIGRFLGHKMNGTADAVTPPGAFLVDQKQADEYGSKLALEKEKGRQDRQTWDVRGDYMLRAAKLRAARSAGSSPASAKLLSSEISNQIYDEMERKLGQTIQNRTPITIAESREYRNLGYIGDDFLKTLGLFKDPLFGGVQPDAPAKADELLGQANARRFPKKPAAGAGATNVAPPPAGGQNMLREKARAYLKTNNALDTEANIDAVIQRNLVQ